MDVAAEDVLSLSNLAVAAAMKPELWQDFLDELGQATGTRVCVQLIGFDAFTHAAPLAFSSGYDPEILRLYETHYADRNPFAENFDKMKVGDTVSTQQLVDTKALQKTEFYRDLLRPLEDIYHGGGAMLAHDAQRMIAIGGNMRAKDAEKYERAWLRLCADLTPILQQSLEINRAISGLSFEKWAAEQHMLGTGTAILVIDGNMIVHFASLEAERLLADGDLIGTGFGRRMFFHSEEAQCKIASLLGCRSQRNANIFGNWYVKDKQGARWTCRASELRLGDLDQSPFGAFFSKSLSGVLLAIKRDESASSLCEALQKGEGLSCAEAQTAVLLSEGRTTAEIAASRNVSIYTARNQLKSAMSKTGCRRQSDLVRRIERLRLRGD